MDVIGSGNIHRCRGQPYEATIYSLQAESVQLETFEAMSKTELTLAVEASDEENPKKRREFTTSLKLPVNFSKLTATCSHSGNQGT